MTERDVIHKAFDEFNKSRGGTKRSGSWFSHSKDAIVVVNLQKSIYSRRYYVNVGIWLLALGNADAPKENKCHIRSRLTQLVPEVLAEHVNQLFDLETPMDDFTRKQALLSILKEYLEPSLEVASSLQRLRSEVGRLLISKSLVKGSALDLLKT